MAMLADKKPAASQHWTISCRIVGRTSRVMRSDGLFLNEPVFCQSGYVRYNAGTSFWVFPDRRSRRLSLQRTYEAAPTRPAATRPKKQRADLTSAAEVCTVLCTDVTLQTPAHTPMKRVGALCLGPRSPLYQSSCCGQSHHSP